MQLRSASLLSAVFLCLACSSSADSDADGGAGTGGTRTGGATGGGGTGGSGTGGAATGGDGKTGGGVGTGGSTTGGATGGSKPATGGTGLGTGGATGGSVTTTGGTGMGGRGTGGSLAGGTGGTPAPAGVSKLPVPPMAPTSAPKPTGSATKITPVHWAGFKAAVTYSFDDDNPSQISNYSKMQALGVPFTFFMWTGKTEANDAVWPTAYKDGHEIGNHTKSHQSAANVTDINAATTFIMGKFGVPPYTLAAPNGDASYSTVAKGLFFINRGVSNALIMPNDNSDPMKLPTFIPPQGASTDALNTQTDQARTMGGWRTFCIHGFTGDGAAYQPIPFDNWVANVTHVKSTSDVWIGTMVDVGSYWQGEKAFGKATAMTSGTDKTYTWTLPDKFPPGKYLRVTTDGGTLKQGGKEVPWDPHGYYEIALDAKEVTLSP